MISRNKLLLKGEENDIFWEIEQQKSNLIVNITAHRPEIPLFHWGVEKKNSDLWNIPPRAIWPSKTRDMHDGQAVQTPLAKNGNNQFSVSITIPQDMRIPGIYFVLYFPHNQQWDNNNHQDYFISFKPQPPVPKYFSPNNQNLGEILAKIIDWENRKHWEMGMRLEFIRKLFTSYPPDESILTLIEVYLQYAAQGHLPWRKNYDRQTYILAPKIQEFSLNLSQQIASYPQFYTFWRRMLKALPSSGRNLHDLGLAIRVRILECKDHRNRHIYDSFMYEFHQKLHNASGPEDVAIAEAYLAFLDSGGDLNQFYQVLLKAGLAKREKRGNREIIISLLDQYGDSRAIHSLPSYDETKAENTQKVVHGLLDLLNKFYGGMEIEEWIEKIWSGNNISFQKQLQDVITKKKVQEERFSFSGSLDILKHLSDMRNQVYQHILSASGDEIRDFVLFDLTLENYAIALTNALLNVLMDQKKSSDILSKNLALVQILLSHLHLSGFGSVEIPALQRQLQQWREKRTDQFDWCLEGKAILDHLNRIIQHQVMDYVSLYQPKAEALGCALKIEERVRQTFSEENVRAGWLFLLSRLIVYTQGILRRKAGWPATEVLVSGKVQGILTSQKDLASLSHLPITKPCILLLEHLQGDEDIPQGVVGIISLISRDRMSHFGIRAREQGVVWIYIEEELEYQKLKSYKEKWVELLANEEHFICIPIEGPDPLFLIKQKERRKIQLPKVNPADSFTLLCPNQYSFSTVGPKAYQLRLLDERLSGKIQVPASLCIPFGVFDLVLRNNPNKAKDYQTLITELTEIIEISKLEKISGNDLSNTLKDLRQLIESFDIKEDYLFILQETIQKRLGKMLFILRSSSNAEDLEGYSGAGLYESYAGVPPAKVPRFLKKVWASKWTERAVRNRFKANISHEFVYLAVLVQQLIPADYAFVVHTHNPLNQNQNEVYIEAVQGLGESLVSGSEGQGYRFIYDRFSNQIKRVGYANKGYQWLVQANGMVEKVLTDYSEDILAAEKNRWESLILQIARSSLLIESAWGNKPQDIEGVIKGKEIYIVQTRPQMI